MKFNHLNVPDQWQHYWTKYPEGYTILEALISWVSQVDDMVDNVNGWNTYLDDFVNTFDSELQEKVVTVLKGWQESGFLNVVIAEGLQWQLDDYIETNEQNLLTINEKLAHNTNDLNTKSINVKYPPLPLIGAKGDGIADDSAVINALLAQLATNGGGVAFIPTGNFLINSSIIIPNRVTLKGSGRGNNTGNGATNIIKDGDFEGVWVQGDGATVSDLSISGKTGNLNDGLYVTGARATVRNIEVYNQGQDGVRIGRKEGAYNTNLFHLSNIITTNNKRDGLHISDDTNLPLPDAGAGVIMQIDARANTRSGVYIHSSLDTVFYNPVCQSNGVGITVGAYSQSTKFFGFYTEANDKEVEILPGAQRTYMIANRNIQDTASYDDKGTSTFILGRDYQNNEMVAINKVQISQLEVSDPSISGKWHFEQDATDRSLNIAMVGTSSAGVIKTGDHIFESKRLSINRLSESDIVTALRKRSGTLSFGTLAPGASLDRTLTVPDAVVGDAVYASPISATTPAGITWAAFVNTEGLVSVRVSNISNEPVVVGSLPFKCVLIK